MNREELQAYINQGKADFEAKVQAAGEPLQAHLDKELKEAALAYKSKLTLQAHGYPGRPRERYNGAFTEFECSWLERYLNDLELEFSFNAVKTSIEITIA